MTTPKHLLCYVSGVYVLNFSGSNDQIQSVVRRYSSKTAHTFTALFRQVRHELGCKVTKKILSADLFLWNFHVTVEKFAYSAKQRRDRLGSLLLLYIPPFLQFALPLFSVQEREEQMEYRNRSTSPDTSADSRCRGQAGVPA